jgi:AmmeMemoRadiSam system protein A
MKLSEQEKKFLLSSARESIQSVFDSKYSPSLVDYNLYPNLKVPYGAFVTLTILNELRGCIGFIISEKSLFETVCEVARHAAFRDPRFLPLTVNELEKVSIEISVLSEPVPIKDYSEIKIGLHGLLLEDVFGHAVLLPQVAVENNYNLYEFLSALCNKAGLISNAWQYKKLNIKVFTAEIISENVKSENE